MSALITAAENGDIKELQRLLMKGEDPSAFGNWAIRRAAYNGHHEIVALLLTDPRVDPTIQNNYCLQHAILKGHTEVVRTLKTDGRASHSNFPPEIINSAFLKGYREIVDLLLGVE
jgi:ankyrin repeat protein